MSLGAIACWAVILFLSGAVATPLLAAFSVFRIYGLGVFVLPVVGLSMLCLLFANAIDVASWGGLTLYGLLFIVTALYLVCGLFLVSRVALPSSRIAQVRWLGLRIWLITAASGLLIETGFRAFPVYDTFEVNPGVRFFWPDWVTFKLNNFGHRDRDFIADKPANTYRVLLLGDSFTEGAGLYRVDTFGRIAETLLNASLSSGAHAEIYNLGHAGRNTREEVDILLRDGPKLSPDLVVLSYVWNDAETHPLQMPYIRTTRLVAFMHTLFLDRLRSYAYYWFYKHITLSKTNFPSVAAFYRSQFEQSSPGWRASVVALGKMEAWLKSRNVPCIVVVWPFFRDDWPIIVQSLAGERVLHELERHGFRVVDLLPDFRQATPKLSDLAISQLDSHPNKMANRLVAARLAQLISSEDSFIDFQRRARASSECGRCRIPTEGPHG